MIVIVLIVVISITSFAITNYSFLSRLIRIMGAVILVAGNCLSKFNKRISSNKTFVAVQYGKGRMDFHMAGWVSKRIILYYYYYY